MQGNNSINGSHRRLINEGENRVTLKEYKKQILAVADFLNEMDLDEEEQSFVAAAVAMMAIRREQQRTK